MNRAPRRWLKIHLLSAIIAMVVTGGLMGLNLRPLHVLGGQGTLSMFFPSDVKVYGWPYQAFLREQYLNAYWSDTQSEAISAQFRHEPDPQIAMETFLERQPVIGEPSYRWYSSNLFYDAIIAVSITLATVTVCEWLIRRRIGRSSHLAIHQPAVSNC